MHALCHVTGGGLAGNLPRVLPNGTVAKVRMNHPVPPIFGLIARGGPVAEDEMQRAFNLGIGLVAVVEEAAADGALRALAEHGEKAWLIGAVAAGRAGAEAAVEIVG